MIKYAVFILDKRRSTLYAMHDEIELLVVVMDSTAPEEMIEEMLREFRFVRRVNVTKLLEKVEKKLFPQLERGRIGFLTQIQLSIAMRKAWQLGQTYWAQVDSDYESQWRKSDVTQQKFQTLVDQVREHIAQYEEPK